MDKAFRFQSGRSWILLLLLIACVAAGVYFVFGPPNRDEINRAIERGDYEMALAGMHSLAKRGDANAQDRLGRMYKEGRGVPQDYGEAVKWFNLAAKQGYAPAQTDLGIMYSKGIGVQQDDLEALRLYRLAAAQGYPYAQAILGTLYENGQGVLQDYGEAVKWYRLAVQQGNAAAQVNLAILYLEGKGVAKDEQEAVKLLRLGAAQGYKFALGNLGALYQSGEGVVQSNVIAYVLFDLAANADSSDSNFAVDSRRNLAKLLIAQDMEAAIFAHNHPSGVAEPSRGDKLLTHALKQALALVDVKVLDHIVVGAASSFSFVERGLI